MDIIDIEILEDGVISAKTDDISGTNHMSADELLNELEKCLGGKRETVHRDRPSQVVRQASRKHVKA